MLIILSTLIIFVLYTLFTTRTAVQARIQSNVIEKETNNIIVDSLLNMETIKAFGKIKGLMDLCRKTFIAREYAERSAQLKFDVIHLGQVIIFCFSFGILCFFISIDIYYQKFTAGDFILCNGYFIQLFNPISAFGQVFKNIKEAIIDLKDVADVLLIPPKIDRLNAIGISNSLQLIEFKNVSFKHNNKLILKNISFQIHLNKTVIVTGLTGSGKSTLGKLLLRFYEVNTGKILLNGINLTKIDLDSYYQMIGYIPQEITLLNDTILSNIKFVKPDATDTEVREAIRLAKLDTLNNSLPDGLNTLISERSLNISGGERQRVAWARIFLRKPQICILDEPTSALDEHTEQQILYNFQKHINNCFKIVFTHRNKYFQNGYKLLHIHKGCLNEKSVFDYNNKVRN